MDLSIVIVNWNSKELLRQCLASVFEHTGGLELEVLVIDSGSFDGCDQMLEEHFPQVRFIQSAENLGFARANNQGARQALGDYLLFLNPDTELTGPAINELHLHVRSIERCGIVGSKLLNADGSVQTSCIQSIPTILNQLLDSEALRRRWPRSSLWGMAPLHDNPSEPREVEGISGACLMVNRQVFESVGGFSEDYFMYAEDMDLAHKVREAGYRNYYVPSSVVIHYGGSSSEQASSTFAAVMLPEAIWRFLRKTRGGLYGFGYRAAMCVSALVRLSLLAASGLLASRAPLNGSAGKWRAVLLWSLRRDGIVHQYYARPEQPSFGS